MATTKTTCNRRSYNRVFGVQFNAIKDRDACDNFGSHQSPRSPFVHRRYAVNIQHVRRVTLVNRPGGAELDIIGIEKSIPISRSRRAVVMEMVESLQQSE